MKAARKKWKVIEKAILKALDYPLPLSICKLQRILIKQIGGQPAGYTLSEVAVMNGCFRLLAQNKIKVMQKDNVILFRRFQHH